MFPTSDAPTPFSSITSERPCLDPADGEPPIAPQAVFPQQDRHDVSSGQATPGQGDPHDEWVGTQQSGATRQAAAQGGAVAQDLTPRDHNRYQQQQQQLHKHGRHPSQQQLPRTQRQLQGQGQITSGSVKPGIGDGSDCRLYKVFSRSALTSDDLDKLFVSSKVVDRAPWMAYPLFSPPERFAPFVLSEGLIYQNAMENAASAMEVRGCGSWELCAGLPGLVKTGKAFPFPHCLSIAA